MLDISQLIVAIAWTFVANGFLIPPSVAPEALPTRWLQPVAEHTRIVFHDRDAWSRAFYVPESAADPQPVRQPTEHPTGSVFLFAPYYLAPDGLVETSDMAVDVAEGYFHALLEAALENSDYPATVAARAHQLRHDVPEPQRTGAYLEAAADFGAHLLSIANEVHRAARRQAAAGRDVCRLVEEPASLFGLWERSIAVGIDRGRYQPRADVTGDASEWLTTGSALEKQDKVRLVKEILDVPWTGDAAHDFARLCPR